MIAPERGGRWRQNFFALPGIVVSSLPVGVCPVCWPLYAGVVSSLGLSLLLSSAYLLPITAACLLISVLTLVFRARQRRGYGPFALGLLAAALILIGKFTVEWEPATYTGVGLLIFSSLWNAWPRRVAPICPKCAPSSRGIIQLSAEEKSS